MSAARDASMGPAQQRQPLWVDTHHACTTGQLNGNRALSGEDDSGAFRCRIERTVTLARQRCHRRCRTHVGRGDREYYLCCPSTSATRFRSSAIRHAVSLLCQLPERMVSLFRSPKICLPAALIGPATMVRRGPKKGNTRRKHSHAPPLNSMYHPIVGILIASWEGVPSRPVRQPPCCC